MPNKDLKEEFKKEFGIFSNYADFCPDVDVYADWWLSKLEAQKQKALECLGEEKKHLKTCMSLQDGYGYKFRDCDNDCQTNGFNLAITQMRERLEKI